ncbi:MAG: hypothetical protein AB7E42_02320 [Anaerotignaceae bacterium]
MANVLYENFVLANKIKDMLDTKLAVNPFMTIDSTLSEAVGRDKIVHVYTATGDVRDVAMGEGNIEADGVGVSFTEVKYSVKYTQGFFPYFDEEVETDPMLIQVGTEKMSVNMVNDLTTKFYTELGKATKTGTYPIAGINFDTVADTIAEFGEDESGLFMLINPAQKAQLRKNLKDELKYTEGYAKTGYVGTICNVPVYTSKAVPTDTAYIATKEAVTCYVKKDVTTEQTREPNTRKNTIYARRENVVALTDVNKVIKLTKAVA